jgi:hypothetical protein
VIDAIAATCLAALPGCLPNWPTGTVSRARRLRHSRHLDRLLPLDARYLPNEHQGCSLGRCRASYHSSLCVHDARRLQNEHLECSLCGRRSSCTRWQPSWMHAATPSSAVGHLTRPPFHLRVDDDHKMNTSGVHFVIVVPYRLRTAIRAQEAQNEYFGCSFCVFCGRRSRPNPVSVPYHSVHADSLTRTPYRPRVQECARRPLNEHLECLFCGCRAHAGNLPSCMPLCPCP